jgi:hypothetical protein
MVLSYLRQINPIGPAWPFDLHGSNFHVTPNLTADAALGEFEEESQYPHRKILKLPGNRGGPVSHAGGADLASPSPDK